MLHTLRKVVRWFKSPSQYLCAHDWDHYLTQDERYHYYRCWYCKKRTKLYPIYEAAVKRPFGNPFNKNRDLR